MARFDVCITEEVGHLVTVEAIDIDDAYATAHTLIKQGAIPRNGDTSHYEIGDIYLVDEDEELVAD